MKNFLVIFVFLLSISGLSYGEEQRIKFVEDNNTCVDERVKLRDSNFEFLKIQALYDNFEKQIYKYGEGHWDYDSKRTLTSKDLVFERIEDEYKEISKQNQDVLYELINCEARASKE